MLLSWSLPGIFGVSFILESRGDCARLLNIGHALVDKYLCLLWPGFDHIGFDIGWTGALPVLSSARVSSMSPKVMSVLMVTSMILKVLSDAFYEHMFRRLSCMSIKILDLERSNTLSCTSGM
jgi:hypothetical protein